MVQNICILLLCSHGLHLVCPEHPRSQQIPHRVCKIQVIGCEDVKFGKIEVAISVRLKKIQTIVAILIGCLVPTFLMFLPALGIWGDLGYMENTGSVLQVN